MSNIIGVSALSILGCAMAGFFCMQDTPPSLPTNESNESQIGSPQDPSVMQPQKARDSAGQPSMLPPNQTPEEYVLAPVRRTAYPIIQPADVNAYGVQTNEVAAAMKAYGKAESEEGRSIAREGLTKALTTEYEQIMQLHEKQLVEMEQRLKSLREQYEKRVAAKGTMVSMRLESIISQADGLGWPTPPTQPNAID